MMDRWVRLCSSSSGGTWGNGGQTQSDRVSSSPFICICGKQKKNKKRHIPPTAGWPCWNGMTSRFHWPLGYLLLYLRLCKKKCCSTIAKVQLFNTSDMMLSLLWKFTLPRWRMAASSLEISQESLSENMRIFRAERKWAYSFTSSRPSQLVQLPWWHDHMVKKTPQKTLYHLSHLSSESSNKKSVLFKWRQYHGQIFVLSSVPKGKNLFLLSWHAHQHVVKDVIVPLLRCLHVKAHVRYHNIIWLGPCYCSCKYSPKQSSHLATNSRLLQQVLVNASPFNGPSFGEVDVNVLPKATGVVISNCFGIAEGWEENDMYFHESRSSEKGGWAKYDDCLIWAHTLQDGVCLKNLLFDPGVLAAHHSQVLKHELGTLSFPCSWFSTDREIRRVSMYRENALNNVLWPLSLIENDFFFPAL